MKLTLGAQEPVESAIVQQAGVADHAEEPPRRARGWLGAAASVRSRILVPYVVLLAVAALFPFLWFQQTLVVGLQNEVDGDLRQEMLELDQLLTHGRDPETGQPFASLAALFDVYFARNVPSREEAFLGFVGDELYRTSTLTRFPLDQLPGEELSNWEELASRAPGEEESSTGRIQTALGDAYFRSARIRFQDDVGAFVVTILPTEERRAIGDFLTYGGMVSLGVLALASVGAWLIAGRVLEPVRQLTDTARSISRSDLTGRIEVRGTGEAAEMARTFNAMLDRLEAVFQRQREFVQDANHELRDPITIVRGYVELMDTDDGEARRRAARLLVDELDRMARITDDLKVLAEAEQPGFLRLEWIELDVFTHELAGKASALAPRGWVVDQIGDGPFLADRHRLTEAVMNLAHNAVQHTVESDTVALGTAVSGDEVHISVRDTGLGISASDQALIFGRLTRGTGAHLRYGGSGLGLAIVKAVAEAHGGRVILTSRLGEGSTFTMVVPRTAREETAGEENPDR
jgi:signal transduction histidine kinase